MKALSAGGRLTLLKSVLGAVPLYYMSLFIARMQVIKKLESIRCHFFNGVEPSVRKVALFKWDNVLAAKEMGGLGVSSFFALNRALVFKWVWRFRSQGNSIWARVIKALHGEGGNLSCLSKAKFPSNWLNITRSLYTLHNKGIDLLGAIKKKVGNGDSTMSWEDPWKGDVIFKDLFPRLYALEMVKSINVANKLMQPTLVSSFRRNVRGGVEQFQLVSLQALLEAATAAIVFAVCKANDHGFRGIQVPKQKRNTGTKKWRNLNHCFDPSWSNGFMLAAVSELDRGEEIPVVMNEKDEDVHYSYFIFVIYPKIFLLLLSAESEDTIFDPELILIFCPKVEMSRDVLTVGSTMRIPLLYRGEYSQWVERFMNYLEEQTDGEAMINSIKNGDQPLPRVTQVSIAETTSTEQPPLEDKSMWSDQEKIIQKIDRLTRSLLIQGLPNDIYSLIDSNKTAKDL
nr:RNA-directed DNA polymerase, eukaryota, reverse transcriptase zinc-binding domain protein [Tanacetum cinerariifolium]